MDYRKLGTGLGIFSLGMGITQIAAAKRIAGALDARGHGRLVKGIALREIGAGVAILAQPAVATGIRGRVAGDVMDIVATSAAARNSPRNRFAWGAIAFVAATALLDVWVAIGLDRQTGKTLPTHPPLPA